MFKDLSYYWKINLAVMLGAAVASAVLTGALLVGDSMQGSLREQALQKLGRIDMVLQAEQFARAGIAAALEQHPLLRGKAEVAPLVLLSGNALHGTSRSRATSIQVAGIDSSFLELFYKAQSPEITELSEALQNTSGQTFPGVIINEALRSDLDAQPGDQIILSFRKPSDIHRESLFGRKETADVVEAMRLTVAHILPDRSMGEFSLKNGQVQERTAFVSLMVLQKAIGQEGKVNVFMLSGSSVQQDLTVAAAQAFRDVTSLSDLGIAIKPQSGYLSVESRSYTVSRALEDSLRQVREQLQAPGMEILSYLANRLWFGKQSTPYSTIVAIDPAPPPFQSLLLPDGSPAPLLQSGEILLNDWLADDLQAGVGDSISVSYFAVGAADQLYESSSRFQVRGVVRMEGAGRDDKLVPEYPGISDVGNIRDWDPPFAVDLSLIRPKDEAYWDEYRSTPKAFIGLAAGQALWANRFGRLSAVRIAPPAGSTVAELHSRLDSLLAGRMDPARLGMRWQNIRQEALDASSGSTDFSQLFVSFSFFLIVSAAMLAGLLFRLGLEQRAPEVGLLLATGYPLSRVRRRFLKQGLVVAVLGALLGLAGAMLYARGIIAALQTRWFAAIGTSFLNYHAEPASLIAGAVSALLVVCLAIWLTLRGLNKVAIPALLRGVVSRIRRTGGRLALWLGSASLLAALVLIGSAIGKGLHTAGPVFMGSGFLLLAGVLLLASRWLHNAGSMPLGDGLPGMALKNAARNPGRSMLCIALVAVACFMIVSVGASRQDFLSNPVSRDSGSGGYRYLAQTDIPLLLDITDEEDRYELGFSDALQEKLETVQLLALRLRPGDDASCLNLFKPASPRILGLSPAFVRRGGFVFASLWDENFRDTPWMALTRELPDEAVPVFADAHSAQYILKVSPGGVFQLRDGRGNMTDFKLVGLLQTSIFQSELLISEQQFLQHFPAESGYRYFLLGDMEGDDAGLVAGIEKTLADYGVDVVSTGEKLAGFQAVENTYRSVFQTLGALGLLLGTLGLGIILVRNVLERRKELAMLRAFGYREQRIRTLLLMENALLVGLGIIVGALCAFIAVLPMVLTNTGQPPWMELFLTLSSVFLTGMLAGRLAVGMALKDELIPALKFD